MATVHLPSTATFVSLVRDATEHATTDAWEWSAVKMRINAGIMHEDIQGSD